MSQPAVKRTGPATAPSDSHFSHREFAALPVESGRCFRVWVVVMER
jgi:hypothetical protein